MNVVTQADHVIDLGPEGGDLGGQVLFEGTPQELLTCKNSFTGKSLAQSEKIKTAKTPHDIKKQRTQDIVFDGVTTNNLKNISVRFPLGKTTVITGVSGSGKSSLAFDTLFSESRNRFTESMSTYARRMMSKVRKPDMEACEGLTPAIAIRQNRFSHNPRSTVGTASEIYDYYRLLFSRFGKMANGNKTNLSASSFSFNNTEGACPTCNGLGVQIVADPEKFITHPEKAITGGAMDGSAPGRFFGDSFGQYVNTLLEVGKVTGIDFNAPYALLTEHQKNIALYGTGDNLYHVKWSFKRGNRSGVHEMDTSWKGMAEYIAEEYALKKNSKRIEPYEALMSELACTDCQGERLAEKVLNVLFGGISISQMAKKSIREAGAFLDDVSRQADEKTRQGLEVILIPLQQKFKTFADLGLDYLSVNRPTSTLSGGESQRLRIASQLAANLCGLTYIFDEPTVGLHAKDTARLMGVINQLKSRGNTVVMVEHDPEIITMADNILDLGPGAGEYGGELIASGTLNQLKANPKSLTGRLLQQNRIIKSQKTRKLTEGISIYQARANNLKHIDLKIPGGGIIAITGVSGSGKTSLVSNVIMQSYTAGKPVNCANISFPAHNNLIFVSQDAIGTNALSTIATYTGLFDLIRGVFADLPTARAHGFKKSHFSFNNNEGRCEHCKGLGQLKVSMDFLSDIWIPCESCHGQRFKDSILDVTYKDKNISDILQMEIAAAGVLFSEVDTIVHAANLLNTLGLGYVKLGQATNTLSGGETQRLKLAKGLTDKAIKNTLILFDEPSTGLHMKDVQQLIRMFHQLVDGGNTVFVIEHNTDIIQSSDWVIELGPEGGDRGGTLVYSGPPREIQ